MCDQISFLSKHKGNRSSIHGLTLKAIKGEGISQRTDTHNPQTHIAVRWWPEERRGEGLVEEGKGEGNENICK